MLWALLLFACHPGPVVDTGADTSRSAPSCDGAHTPETIEEATALLTALQERVGTVDGACVVRALARPLVVVANSSVTSAQPARGAERPRLFVQSGPLTLSLVPAGPGSQLLEFGELSDPLRTRKGELELPITAPVPVEAPFEKVAHPEYGTTCAVCHDHQEDHPLRGTVSAGIRPDTWTDVPLDELAREAAACEGEGCALLEALFEDELRAGSFPEEWPTVRELSR